MPGKHLILAGLTACLALTLPAVCLATTFTVNSLSDTGTGTGTTGDLRYVINQANNAGSGDIIFSVTGTIALSSKLPTITGDVTITGPAGSSGIAIDGGSAVELMQVNAGATVRLQFLTLANPEAK